MKALITSTGQIGPFNNISALSDRWSCDGTEYQFSVIGEATVGVWVQPPPSASVIAQSVKEVDSKIKIERDKRIQTGGYKVGTKWFHSDTFSRTQQMGLVMLGANIPPNTPWKTMDGSFVIMTQTLANQIFGAAALSDIAIFTTAETHRANLSASSSPSLYNFMAGWPQSYEESLG